MSAGDWHQIEQAARARARNCAQRATEATEHGSAVASREWSEAEQAALAAAETAARARMRQQAGPVSLRPTEFPHQ